VHLPGVHHRRLRHALVFQPLQFPAERSEKQGHRRRHTGQNGKKLATTDSDGDRVYIDDSSVRHATAHSVGDNYGQTFGAENFYSKYLLGFDQSIFERIAQAVSGKPGYGSDVTLTIDAALCDTAYDAMGDYRGAVVVMNYKTGEILASVSHPRSTPNMSPSISTAIVIWTVAPW
jgi:hypothetical protein